MSLMNFWCGNISLRGFVATAAISSVFLFAACGDESGTSKVSEPAEVADIMVDTFDGLPVCSDKREGMAAYVKGEKIAYTCIGGDWTLANRFNIEDTFDDLSVCSDKREGVVTYIKDEKKLYTCINGDWTLADGWSWNYPKEFRFNAEITYGTMTDPRDGQTYKTVKIGDQVWMAENLNYADSVTTASLIGKSWCYNNEPENCAVAGRLYKWAAAIDSVKLTNDLDNPRNCFFGKTCTLPDTIYGICPSGWHLPSNTEWETLFSEVGGSSTAGKILKSQTGWSKYHSQSGNGTDDVGFSALPVGYMDNEGFFYSNGKSAQFWGVTVYMALFVNEYVILYNVQERIDNAFSVRCLKN